MYLFWGEIGAFEKWGGSSPKLGVAPVYARTRSLKPKQRRKRILSDSPSGGSRPALLRRENAEVSVSFMFISYKYIRYIIKINNTS